MNFHGRRPLFNVAVGRKKKKKRKYGMFRVRVILERGLTAFQLVERNDEIRSIFFYRDSLIWIITWIINLLFFLLLYFYFPFFFILLFLWVRLDWIGSPPFDFVFRFSVSIYIYILFFVRLYRYCNCTLMSFIVNYWNWNKRNQVLRIQIWWNM